MNINYSELNPTVSYNFTPYNQNSMDNFEKRNYIGSNLGSNVLTSRDSLSFEKYQEKISNVGKDESYYCGGNSSMAIRGMQIENSQLSVMYFSNENTNRIQRHIKREIFRRTNGKYKLNVDQDESDLLIAMRAVFAEHAKFLPTKTVKQVKILNKQTIDYIVPDMITNIHQDSNYLKTISNPIQPLDRPINANGAGRKTLPSFTSIYGF